LSSAGLVRVVTANCCKANLRLSCTGIIPGCARHLTVGLMEVQWCWAERDKGVYRYCNTYCSLFNACYSIDTLFNGKQWIWAYIN